MCVRESVSVCERVCVRESVCERVCACSTASLVVLSFQFREGLGGGL